MEDNNSLDTQFYVSLTVQLFHDITQCYPDSRDSRLDLAVMLRRFDCEGLSFFTKSLPKLGKAIDYALSSDTKLQVKGFCLRPQTSIPRFLGWLIVRVFSEDGYVRSDPDITALQHLRQFLYFLYKLKLPYDSNTERSVIEAFVQTQESLRDVNLDQDDLRPIIDSAAYFIRRVFDGYDVRDIIPRHGPGAVATGEEVGEKSNFSRLYAHTERMYPFTEYYVFGLNHIADQLDWIQSLEVLQEGTAKVVLVPKDSRGPRLISKEPLELQWIQQGIQKSLYSWIESHKLTAGHVNFSDQRINQKLALQGSRDSSYATLDMKDASDRVSLRLVERLFAGTELLEALLASRSHNTQLPDGTIVHLNTFAPMGSAVCFPVEAMCFYALAVSAIAHMRREYRNLLDPNDRRETNNTHVYVYGDDIITRREDYSFLLRFLPLAGLKFNESKCCVAGFFRESCGCDAFKGIEVTPTRLRATWCSSGNRSAEELLSYVALSNALWDKGYWSTSEWIRAQVERRYGVLPVSTESYEYFDLAGRVKIHDPPPITWKRVHESQSAVLAKMKTRWNTRLHKREVYSWIIVPHTKKYEVDGWRECLRVVNTKAHEGERDLLNPPSNIETDSGTYALPHRVWLKRGWVEI